MKRENENKLLLPFNWRNHSFEHIVEIADLQKGKTFDLLHVIGVDPWRADRLPPEELAGFVAEMSEVDKCYMCDASGLVESLKESFDQENPLAEYQFKHIVQILVLAYYIKTKGYDKVIYYESYSDHRLNTIPASMILKDLKCFCLKNGMEGTSLADVTARRFFLSHNAMEEKDVRKLCRKILRSHVLETLELEEVDYTSINNS